MKHTTPQINLTPLIDVVFVILIMFIVIVPMLQIESIDLAEGSKELPSLQEGGISIIIDANNKIFFNHQEVSIAQLKTALTHVSKEEVPQLFEDQDSRFGTYQMVKNVLADMGFKQVDVILKPSS